MLNIKQRQMNFKFLGLYNGEIDGITGNQTRQAILDFQKKYGLCVDGIYGPKTDAKLIEIIKEEQSKLGVVSDGIAGAITINARDNIGISWNDIKHFEKSEFACKCGCGFDNVDLKLVKILDEIRDFYGKPLYISSGCRCASHNASVGGVENSRHKLGKASDIYIKGVAKSDLLSKCKEYVSKGRARYTYTNNEGMANAVHIDVN